jgi:stage II sporulation protein D
VRAVFAILLAVAAVAASQTEVTEVDLDRAGGSRTIALGALSTDRHVTTVALETYVSRVLAGEAERDAPDGELEALAIAIRTFAIFNAGRHARDGFDLCDTTHCQVPRPSTAATRRAALATAGQILTWHGAPAEIFYSASCGGKSESAAAVWPGSNLPYLKAVKDDVHDDDVPWVFDLPMQDVQRALARRGFAGARLKDVRVASHTSSGRVGTLRLSGLEPDVIAADQFRSIVGTRDLKSTAFTVQKHGDALHFTGRGYGHGVGMCVIGAGRRARRGESVRQILKQYYPGLEVTPLDRVTVRKPGVLTTSAPRPAAPASAPSPAASAAVAIAARSPVTMRGPDAAALQQAAVRAHDAMVKVLGASVAPVTVDVHESVEDFRQATGKPWWVSVSVSGTDIDLAPLALLAQRDGVEMTLRNAMVQAIAAAAFADRPEWVKVGAARYFAQAAPSPLPDRKIRLKCPADAELTLAISASAQREAEARAEQCFARAYAGAKDWRAVR